MIRLAIKQENHAAKRHGPWQNICRALAVLRDERDHPTGRKLRFNSPRSGIAAPSGCENTLGLGGKIVKP